MGTDAHHQKKQPYMLVWAALFALTMMEVFYAFLDISQFWLATGLILMAIWKALLVAVYYMHLRSEPKRMWVLAASPLPLIAILLVIVLQENF